MPDADGRIRGITLDGKAGEAWKRIFGGATNNDIDAAARRLEAAGYIGEAFQLRHPPASGDSDAP